MTTSRTRIGAIGEQIAVRRLEAEGMVVLDRNWRCATPDVRGEIDIVARDGAEVVFCEVKTRRRASEGAPLESITPRKLAQLRRLAAAWLAESELRAGRVRIDAVGIWWPASGGAARVTHLRAIG